MELIFCRYGDGGGLQCYTIKKWISGENYKSFTEKRTIKKINREEKMRVRRRLNDENETERGYIVLWLWIFSA